MRNKERRRTSKPWYRQSIRPKMPYCKLNGAICRFEACLRYGERYIDFLDNFETCGERVIK